MDTTFIGSDECPSVYRIRFMPSELTTLYDEILGSATISSVTDCLCKYVTDSIEPIGWRAIWRTQLNDNNGLSLQVDFEVEIIDVLRSELEAIGVVLRQVAPNETQLSTELLDEKEKLLKNTKVVNIPLTQLYVVSDGDTDNQYYRTAVIIEQMRFFYQNLWRPWDELISTDANANEVFVETKLKPRLELSFDIKDKIIPQSTVNRIKNLLSEGWAIKRQINCIDSYKPMDSMDISIEDNSETDYINETDLVHAVRLKLRLEDIEREMRLLEDKHLRIIAASLKNSLHTNGNYSNDSEDDDQQSSENKIHLIAQTFTKESLVTCLAKVTTDESAPIMFHNSFGHALASIKSGDKIYVLPGLYSCPILPWIESNIDISGVGGPSDEIIIEAKDSIGDIFVNCNADRITFTGLTLRSTSELQCLLMIHNGFVSFKDCILDGAYQTRNALIVLSKAKVEIEKCTIINETTKGNGIISRKGSVVINRDMVNKSHEMPYNLISGDTPSAPELDLIDT